MCSTCQDVTADSIVIDDGNSVEIPGGLTLEFVHPGSQSDCNEYGCASGDSGMLTTLPTNITLNRNRTANILTLALGQLKDDTSGLDLTNRSNWKAVFCSLDLCIKRYSNFTVVCFDI